MVRSIWVEVPLLLIVLTACSTAGPVPLVNSSDFVESNSDMWKNTSTVNQTLNHSVGNLSAFQSKYDWVVRLWGCERCSPLQMRSFSMEVLDGLPEEHFSFLGYDVDGADNPLRYEELNESQKLRGIVLNATYEGYEIIEAGAPEGIKTVYTERIIPHYLQAIPDDNEALVYCEENRDCVRVATNCCCGEKAINTRYHEYWKTQFNCSEPTICPAVACPQFSLLCEDNRCKLSNQP